MSYIFKLLRLTAMPPQPPSLLRKEGGVRPCSLEHSPSSPREEGEYEQDNQIFKPLSPGRGVGVRQMKKEGLV